MQSSQPCSEIIDDIEDLISSQDIQPKQRYANKKNVVVRAKRNGPTENGTLTAVEKPPIYENFVPELQKIYVKTWGCSHNNSDSEYMSGILAESGYKLTSDKDSADLWLLNR